MSPYPESISPILHLLLAREDAPSNDTNSALVNQTNSALSPNQTIGHPANSTISPAPTPEHHDGLSGWIVAIIVILAFLAIGAAGFTIYKLAFARHRPASEGFHRGPLDSIKAWFAATTYKLRNPRNRQAGAGFEGISAGAAGMGAGGSRYVDGGDVWDARVHDDEEYGIAGNRGVPAEGFEMGPTRFSSEYKGAGSEYNIAGGRYRDENVREYNEDEGRGRGPIPVENPFADEHATNTSLGAGGESQLRSVSPRPMLGLDTHHLETQTSSRQGSPTRRSIFHEEMGSAT